MPHIVVQDALLSGGLTTTSCHYIQETEVARTTRSSRPLCYHVITQSRTEQHSHSFFHRTLRQWYTLPLNVVMAPSVDAFRRYLTEEGR